MASEIDEYVNGLPVKDSPFRTHEQTLPLGSPVVTPHRPIPPRRGLTRGVAWCIVGCVAVVSFWCGGVLTPNTPPAEPAKTVYVTQPPVVIEPTAPIQLSMPQSCRIAIQKAEQVLRHASVVGSATDKILDLLSAANIAAQKGDTKGMNAAVEGLRKLDGEITHDRAETMLPYQQLMDGLATCQAD